MARNMLQSRHQKEKESITEFAKAVEQLVKKGYPAANGYTDDQRTSLVVDSFIRGLKRELKKVMLRKNKPATLADAIVAAQKEEMIQTEIEKGDESEKMKSMICSLEKEVRDMRLEIKTEKEKVNVISNSQNTKQGQQQNWSQRGYKKQNFGRGNKNQNYSYPQQWNPNFIPRASGPMQYQNSWPPYQGTGRGGRSRGRGRGWHSRGGYQNWQQYGEYPQFWQNHPPNWNGNNQNYLHISDPHFNNNDQSNNNHNISSISKFPYLISLIMLIVCLSFCPTTNASPMFPGIGNFPPFKLFGWGK